MDAKCRQETIRVTAGQLREDMHLLGIAVDFVMRHNKITEEQQPEYADPTQLESSIQLWLERAEFDGECDLWSLADEWNEDADQDEWEECAYCGSQIHAHAGEVPPFTDDDAWAELATEHSKDCEWVTTRAHSGAYKTMRHEHIHEAFDLIDPAAIGTGCNADGEPDGSDDWNHPSAESARKITKELGMVWDFDTWRNARILAHRALDEMERE